MATWYRTGTVALTNGSPAVTGTGTAFVANVKIGDAFNAPDGRVYEIAGVISDTQLTLQSNYLGSTASNQNYAIQPTRAVTVQLVTDVQSLISAYADVKNKAGAGKFQSGTAALPGIAFEVDQDLGFYRAAANKLGIAASAGVELNAPITGTAVTQSATDTTAGRLLTPGYMGLGKSVNLGGADSLLSRNLAPGFYSYIANQIPDSPENLSYFHSLIVTREEGTGRTGYFAWRLASDKPIFWAGVDDGTTLKWVRLDPERGSNSNGEYVRFADGTQICWTDSFGSVGTNIADGSVFKSTALTWTFPASFLGSVPLFVKGVANANVRWVGDAVVNSASASFVQFAATSSGTAVSMRAFAIGRCY